MVITDTKYTLKTKKRIRRRDLAYRGLWLNVYRVPAS